jgi:hypothetical protein
VNKQEKMKLIQSSYDNNKIGYPMDIQYSRYINIVKRKINLNKNSKSQECLGNPDIFGPQQDMCGCRGGGCPRCWN